MTAGEFVRLGAALTAGGVNAVAEGRVPGVVACAAGRRHGSVAANATTNVALLQRPGVMVGTGAISSMMARRDAVPPAVQAMPVLDLGTSPPGS
jgi:hypothetical protein